MDKIKESPDARSGIISRLNNGSNSTPLGTGARRKSVIQCTQLELADERRILDRLEKQPKASEVGTNAHVKVLQERFEKAASKNSESKEVLDDASAEHKELLENNTFQEQFERKENRWLEHMEKLKRQAKKRKLEDGEICVERQDFQRGKDLEFLTTENNFLREQISSIGEEINNLQDSVTQTRFDLAKESRILEQLEKRLKSNEAGTNTQVKVLQEQLEKAVAKNSDFEEILDDAVAECKELLDSNQFLKDENDLLKKELTSKCETVEDLKSELGELQKLLDMKTIEVEELDNRECEAVEELNKMAEKLKEINKLKKDEISEIHLETDSLQKDIERLTIRIQEAINKANLPVEDLKTENENLRMEIERLKIDKLELEKDAELDKRKYESEIANLTKKNEALENQIDAMKKNKDDAVKSANELKIKNELLKSEIDSKTHGLKSFTKNRQLTSVNNEKLAIRPREENEKIRKDLKISNEAIMKKVTPLKSDQVEKEIVETLKKSSEKTDKEMGEIKAVIEEKEKEKTFSELSQAKKLRPKSGISFSNFLPSDGDFSPSSGSDFCPSQSPDRQTGKSFSRKKKVKNITGLKTLKTKIKSSKNRKKWTPETKTAVLKYFRRHVSPNCYPGKLQILECAKNLKIDSFSSLVFETKGGWEKVASLVFNAYKPKPLSRKLQF